ncbi:MAG: hypothetical protein IKJ00_09605 [Clostridia bacterium]|nr:hypothetical protein [Clostridia bacterium]
MRKKKLLAVSLLLVILQIVSLFAMIPTAAASKGRSYTLYKAETAPTLDGIADLKNEDWCNVPWSENFYKVSGGGAQAISTAKFKAMWTESVREIDGEDVECTDIWIYAYIEDGTTTTYNDGDYYTNDYFAIVVGDSSGNRLYSNGRTCIDKMPAFDKQGGAHKTNSNYITESTKNESVASWKGVDVDLGWQDNREATEGTKYYAIEYMVSLPASRIGTDFRLDVFFNDCTGTRSDNNDRAGYCWDSMTTADNGGSGDVGRAVLSNISVSKAYKYLDTNFPRAYTFYKAETAPDNDEAWNNIEWSKDFYKTGGSENIEFNANFKALWVDNTKNSTVDLYFYLHVTDSTTTEAGIIGDEDHSEQAYWTNDYFTISVDANRDGDDDDSGEIDSNFRGEVNLLEKGGTISRSLTFTLDDKRGTDDYYTVTLCIPINKALITDNQFDFDLMVNNCGAETSNIYTRMAWNGMNNTGYVGNGIGYLSEYASASDEPILTQAGAGTRLNDPAGLRFETRINKANYDKLLSEGATITTGTLIIPTSYLINGDINNSDFTIENLNKFGFSYLNVVNNGWANATSADTDGYYQYYGSIVGIKTENLDRNFSGIGYMTVKTTTEEYTLYGSYSASYHSRSVQYVAAAAIASGEYDDDLTTLQSFIKDSAPAKADGATYRIMQYNLMRKGENWGGSALEIPYLDSSVRVNITSAAIEGYNPDILVVNERFDDTWSELGLSNKYKVIGETTNRNAIVYNSDVFEEVVKSGSKAFTESDGVNYRNVSYAILKDGEQLIAVFATHWGTDSNLHASQLADMQSCMNEVLTGEYADIPVVIAGDFNSAATATEYSKLITDGGYFNVDAATSVDHIAVKGFEVVGAGRDTKSYTKFASDHKPIYADIAIKIGG